MEYRTRLSEQLYDLSDSDVHAGYTDIFDGSEYEELYVPGELGEDHIVIGMAADGAQRLRNKVSDRWMWIWILY
ncbi:hypothetical protein QCA50_017797 [Cerrena zonata]|uniref:Uncharacterized protein n=1 Tax=Cerrena zonata TaxID=2478898 RepID=A0AAW0FJV9_9APHY